LISGILFLFIGIVGLWVGLPYVVRKVSERKLATLCRSSKAVVLTYDDGPSANLTSEVLELLDQYAAKATFFMLGDRLDDAVETGGTVVAQGHELGSHSQSHLNAWREAPWRIAVDLRHGFRSIEALGVPVRFFRPPHGKLTLGSMIQVLIRGDRLGWWTIDSTDTNTVISSPEKIAQQVSKDGGGVVLLHDFDRGSGSDRNRFVLDTTRCLLEMAKREGYRVMPLGQLYARIDQN